VEEDDNEKPLESKLVREWDNAEENNKIEVNMKFWLADSFRENEWITVWDKWTDELNPKEE
jgi:hypothetical protein